MNVAPLRNGSARSVIACGVRKLLAAPNESPVIVCIVPRTPTRIPVTVTVSFNARSRLVLTAFTNTRLAVDPEISGDGSLIVFVSPLNYTAATTSTRLKIYLIER